LSARLEIRTFLHAFDRVFLVRLLLLAFLSCAVAAQQAPPAPQARFVVVLDAAHGGDDAGGRLANNQLEKSFTLALSVRLRSLLGARGIQVVTTRESDVAVEPEKRSEIANHAQAQACLSLHASDNGSGAFICLLRRSRPLSPRASPPGRPRRPPG
jgi:hypothetical protein